jgi:hypothetical protein
MSFLNSLFKGFIRSAVNQVGRDGGKVISNQLYGNAHAAPVRVSQNQSKTIHFESTSDYIEPINADNSPYNFRSMAAKDNLIPKAIAYILFSLFFPFLGSIFTIFIGREYAKKQLYPICSIEKIPITKPDKRYNSGVRTIGYRNKVVTIGYKPLDESHLKYFKTKGSIYKKIGWYIIIIYTILGVTMAILN